jgi:hypothetical protein
MTAPSEIARRLGDAWAQYANEFLASIDARCEGRALSQACGHFRDIRRLLYAAVATGEYHSVPRDVRQAVIEVPVHVRDHHPEYWHLFFDDPGPAARALMDQVEAARRQAEVEFGPK